MGTFAGTPGLTAGLAFGLCGGLLGLAELIGRRGRVGIALAGLIALGAGALLAAGQPALVWVPVGLFALLWLGCRLLLSPRPASARLWRHPRLYGGLTLAAVPVLAGVWLDLRPPARDDQLLAQANNPVRIQAYRDLFLYTDRGRRVRTYEPGDRPPFEADPAEVEAAVLARCAPGHQLIRVSGPDLICNCHGWTFGGGLCWLQGAEAEIILRENGYERVAVPQPGDVVLYTDLAGQPAHSGVVVGQSRTGDVLVESKWSWGGLFIHEVQTQPYAGRWEFYHSERPGGSTLIGLPGHTEPHTSLPEAP